MLITNDHAHLKRIAPVEIVDEEITMRISIKHLLWCFP